ncbi:MAG: hypothetical protein AMS21_08235 [Gemmatimonas sp. SG8_38_2]|nr:MAG: hypothetical protein AMS21_08235 [Gemmatimonas sp. SG8_38_2]
MERCQGKTKFGKRCKRMVPKGSRFCVSHANQAHGLGGADAAGATCQEQDSLDNLIILAVAGAVLYLLLTLRRFSSFL